MVIIKQLFKKKEWLNVIQRLSENDNLSLNKRYQVSKYKNWRANFDRFPICNINQQSRVYFAGKTPYLNALRFIVPTKKYMQVKSGYRTSSAQY